MKRILLSIVLLLVADASRAHKPSIEDSQAEWATVSPVNALNSVVAAVEPGEECQPMPECSWRMVGVENQNDFPVQFVVQHGDRAMYYVRTLEAQQTLITMVGINGATFRFRRLNTTAVGDIKPPIISILLHAK